jgi:hypothetical protein
MSTNASPVVVTPVVNAQVSMDNGTSWQPVMTNPAWGSVQLTATGPVKYRVTFNSGASSLNSILLASPIVDDITIYYEEVVWLRLSMNA